MSPQRTPVQETAITCPGSLCVTAGAGTGKTYVLVSRYLDLLEREGDEQAGVQEILALTFTEKAAAEMKDRVRRALAAAEGEEAARFRDDLMWAGISTIHSFCTRILREYALEAGLEPGFAVIESYELAEMTEETLYRLLYTPLPEPVRTAVLSCLRTFGVWELQKTLIALYDQRWNADRFFTWVTAAPDAVIAVWMEAAEAEQADICAQFFASPAGEAAAVLRDLAMAFAGDDDAGTRYLAAAAPGLKALDPDCPGETCRALADILSCKGSKNMGSAKIFGQDGKRQLITAYTALKEWEDDNSRGLLTLTISPDDPKTTETIHIMQALGTTFSWFSETIGQMKAQRGAIDFGDMLIHTQTLLAENPAARNGIAAKYRAIMVDEFQDTDPLQAAIISDILTAAGKKRSLFVVGDPKQSIYLFRNADVTQFKATRDRILAERGGREVALDTSFRSAPEIIGLVNTLFSAILGADRLPWEFGYDALGVTESRETHTGSAEILITPPGKNNAERDPAEADAVATWLASLVREQQKTVYERGADREWNERPASFGDCAVLIETRSRLHLIEDAFCRAGVPYRIYGGTAFYERQEVRDCAAVIAFLADNSDDIALYGALRSPFFGLSDADIFRAADGRGQGLFSRLREDVTGPVADACQTLARWQTYARREPPSVLVSRILRESGMYAVCAGQKNGDQKTANLRKITGIARSRETVGCYGFDDFAADIRQAVRDAPKEEDAPLPTAGEDAVLVMTVHASKGLEFPVVALPFTNADSGGRRNGTVFEEELGLAVKIPGSDGPIDAPISLLIQHRRRQKEAAEARRLFYVAVTRARDHILFTGTLPNMELVALGPDAGKTRMHRTFAALGITPDAVEAGGVSCTTPNGREWRITITTAEHSNGAVNCSPPPVAVAITAPLPAERADAAWTTPPPPAAGRSRPPLSVTAIHRYASGGMGAGEPDPVQLLQSGGEEKHSARKGNLMHAVFAGMAPAHAGDLHGFSTDDTYLSVCAAAYQQFCCHPFIRESTCHQCEVKFVHRFGDVQVRGAIDRIVRRADGQYVVIDYKTEADPEDRPCREEHLIQLAVYADAVCALTGSLPDTCLYYTRTGRLVHIAPDIPAARLAAAEAEKNR
ncbi:exodeoxyribonuclease V subunit beta [Methanogenium sp. MK-MG]|uniref:UvrD-helicase domain-containing protein n=1 Tax=Methanogenium sp. MK-MG TaxID=2599926 RepID=UPI0013EC5022|nr:UvrD-helicase domain-containing protein [Methanogenium sp. MK-MG]KAF1078535.1 ATP-dependent helicase/nuclease subunit A [Methanogenium sp. MK-MG]